MPGVSCRFCGRGRVLGRRRLFRCPCRRACRRNRPEGELGGGFFGGGGGGLTLAQRTKTRQL